MMFDRDLHQGFTLVEMLIIVSIMAIVMAFALPAYSRFIAQNRVQALTAGLQADFGHARVEAIRTGASVRICAADMAGGSCAGGHAAWRQGWLLQVASGASWTTAVVRQEMPVVVASASSGALVFMPSGRVGAVFSLTFTDANAVASSTLEVAAYGAISLR